MLKLIGVEAKFEEVDLYYNDLVCLQNLARFALLDKMVHGSTEKESNYLVEEEECP